MIGVYFFNYTTWAYYTSDFSATFLLKMLNDERYDISYK